METECVCEYDDSNDKGDSLSCPIVERKYVFTRFKTLKDLSSVAVEGSIVSKMFNIRKTSFFLHVPMPHKDGLGLPGLWDIIPTLLSIFLLQG
jgi:hypothetical protein